MNKSELNKRRQTLIHGIQKDALAKNIIRNKKWTLQ